MEINDISKFLEAEKEAYVERKVKEYIEKGDSKSKAVNKANQSWRTYIGSRIQQVILELLKKELKEHGLKVISDRALSRKKLSPELDLVRRMIAVNYGKYLFLPDADIIIYKNHKDTVKIIAIVSVKNSFRERGFETTYWKLRLKESPLTSHIKVYLATPDKDGEISYIAPRRRPKKMRVILEYELDGIYFLKEGFEKTPKAKHFSEIIEDIIKVAK